MKKLYTYFAALAVLFTIIAPAHSADANVQNFSFKNFIGDYYLSKDSEGRSRLKVVETFTAAFPDYDQNKGVVRAIPKIYDNHTVSIKVESLQRNDQPEPIYSQETENDNVLVSTGNDNFLRGDQTYKLTYTLRDVTKNFDDHQEFYWDTVGTVSPQPFGGVTARVHLDDSVRDLFEGDTACFEGPEGSTTSCTSSTDGNVITFTSNGSLAAKENLSMVLKFTANTFNAYKEDPTEHFIKTYGIIAPLGLGIGAVIWAIYVRRTRGRSAPGRSTIIPEYAPPKNISVLVSSVISGTSTKALPAQFIDLAVRRKIKIIEEDTTKKKKSYSIEVTSVDGLSDEEKKVLEHTTGLTVGGSYALKASDTKTGTRLYGLLQNVTSKQIYEQGYKRKEKASRTALLLAVLALMSSIGLLSWFAVVGYEGWKIAAALSGVLGFVVTLLITLTMRPLTEKGVLLKEYLAGFKMYIGFTEEERLKVLQSPEGAEKTPIDASDTKKLVELYELALPYAMLFGQEKQWAKTLEIAAGPDYNPQWHTGQNVLTGALIGSMISDFTTASAASFTSFSPTNSGSSGFSGGGGGFSGGGGGGGGFGGR